MEVVIFHNGRKYTYKHNGAFFTWVDERNLTIPVMIHTILREKALSEGADASIFLSKPKQPSCEARENTSEDNIQNNQIEKAKKKKNLNGGFNPFNIGG